MWRSCGKGWRTSILSGAFGCAVGILVTLSTVCVLWHSPSPGLCRPLSPLLDACMPAVHSQLGRASRLGLGALAAHTLGVQVRDPRRMAANAVDTQQPLQAGAGITGAAGGSKGGPGSVPRVVNLRDIGEVSEKIHKARVFRCSQIYGPEILKELKVKTVVDLRGRTKKHKTVRSERHRMKDAAKTASIYAEESEDSPPSTPTKRDVVAVPASSMTEDYKSTGSLDGMAQNGDKPSGATQDNIRTVDLDDTAAGEPGRLNFNLIPNKQFGLSLLKFPLKIWLNAADNLVKGKDARKPFVDAFADEKVLGFTKYYLLMLEHSKRQIASVLRVFKEPKNLPALVHCAHGKDRTGVIIMLLMMLCDLTPEEIVSDYIQSEMQLKAYREALGMDIDAQYKAPIPLNDMIIASTEQTIRGVMIQFLDKYHTVEDYLITTGLSPEEIAAIKRNLTEDKMS